jgi:hypothetical protein
MAANAGSPALRERGQTRLPAEACSRLVAVRVGGYGPGNDWLAWTRASPLRRTRVPHPQPGGTTLRAPPARGERPLRRGPTGARDLPGPRAGARSPGATLRRARAPRLPAVRHPRPRLRPRARRRLLPPTEQHRSARTGERERRDCRPIRSAAPPGEPSGHREGAHSRPEEFVPPPDGTSRRRRLDWADLLRRVFAVDVLECPSCGPARPASRAVARRLRSEPLNPGLPRLRVPVPPLPAAERRSARGGAPAGRRRRAPRRTISRASTRTR